MKIQKKIGGGSCWGGGGGRLDVNEELKFLGKFKKKNGGRGEGGVGGRGGGGGGPGGCERRIEVLVKIKKKIGGGVGGVRLGGQGGM